MTDRSLEEVIKDLDQLTNEYSQKLLQETEIQQQISDLRSKLTTIQLARRDVKVRISKVQKEQESAERKASLEKEQQRIEKDFEELRKEAEDLIVNAPWRGTIFDWQVVGAVKLAAAERGLLADVRGMGKTLSSIAWRTLVGSEKTLVLTRKQYADEFIKELSIREPGLTVIPLIGANPVQRKTMTSLMAEHKNFVIVANFEMWRRSTEEAIKDLLSVGFDAVILDEAHQLKNFSSVTTRGFMQLAQNISKVLEMTGTPIQNRPQELFSILHSLYPDLFPKEQKFIYDYCYQVDQNRWSFTRHGLNTLMEKMSNFFVARTPEEVGHKVPPPDIKHYKLDFEGYPEQYEAYKVMAERALAKIDAGKVLPITSQLALMTRQAQMTAWPAGINFVDEDTGQIYNFDIHQSVKIDWAEDLIRELADENQPVILFSRFKAPIYELKKRLQDLRVGVITGDTYAADNRIIINDFDPKTAPEDPNYIALLATYDTVGESVNLNRARHVILFDRYFKPSKDDQAIGRIDRINSVDQATVHMAAVANTIDVYMEDLIQQKRDLLNNFKSASDMQQSLRENLEASL